jgi:hypothetical protein
MWLVLLAAHFVQYLDCKENDADQKPWESKHFAFETPRN